MSDLYIHAAAVLDNVAAQKGSLKGLVMSQARRANGIDAKRLLALTANTLAYTRALDFVLEASRILAIEKRTFAGKNLQDKNRATTASAKSLVLVLAHDLLFSPRGRIATSAAWPPHAAVQRNAARLRAELVKLQVKEGKASIEGLKAGQDTLAKAARIPRWVRVNERKTTVQQFIAALAKEGWREEDDVSSLTLKSNSFVHSRHVSSVFAFHPSRTSWLIQHDLYKKGHIMLQDLASCFPARILLHDSADSSTFIHALDATAAPGNKTSHLSALLSKRIEPSEVIAMEHMQPRHKILVEQLKRAGALDELKAGRVTTKLCDFMKQDPKDYANVTHMLLDPSCSGSGILGRLDFLSEGQEQVEDSSEDAKGEVLHDAPPTALATRLQNLSSFQQNMIEHAMTFPALSRLAYSTCSIHHEENEDVVLRVLGSDIAKRRGWRLATRSQVIPMWPTRGQVEHCGGDEALAEAMVRCIPGGASNAANLDMEATNGFFVTLFVRDAKEDAHASTVANPESRTASNTAKNRKRKLRAKQKQQAEKRARQGVEHGDQADD